MNFLDIIIIIPIIWSIFKGYKKGFVIELASLAALILGIYAAIKFSANFTSFLESFLDMKEKYINIIAFILTFIAVAIVIMLVGKVLEKIIKIVMLGLINRVIGAVFGIAKMIVILSFVILLFELIDDRQKFLCEDKKDASLFYSPVASIAPVIIDIFHKRKYNIA